MSHPPHLLSYGPQKLTGCGSPGDTGGQPRSGLGWTAGLLPSDPPSVSQSIRLHSGSFRPGLVPLASGLQTVAPWGWGNECLGSLCHRTCWPAQVPQDPRYPPLAGTEAWSSLGPRCPGGSESRSQEGPGPTVPRALLPAVCWAEAALGPPSCPGAREDMSGGGLGLSREGAGGCVRKSQAWLGDP